MVAVAGGLGRGYQASSEVTFTVRKSKVEVPTMARAKMFSGAVPPNTAGTSPWFPRPSDPGTLCKTPRPLSCSLPDLLTIEFAVRELARVIFVFGHFGYHRKSTAFGGEA